MKNDNKHALTSLAPPTEQIALPAVNFMKYTRCSHSIFLSCCFFSRKMSQKRLCFTAEKVRDAVRAVHSGGAFKSVARDLGIPRSTLRRRIKCPFLRRIGGQRTFSKDEEETMATVVKGFETTNLRLTRRKFLLFRSDVYVTSLPFFHCIFFLTFFGSLSWFLRSVIID